jgi:hypothetical protein
VTNTRGRVPPGDAAGPPDEAAASGDEKAPAARIQHPLGKPKRQERQLISFFDPASQPILLGSTDQRLRWPTKKAPSPTPMREGGLAWFRETKTKPRLFLGARRGLHPLGSLIAPSCPETVLGHWPAGGPEDLNRRISPTSASAGLSGSGGRSSRQSKLCQPDPSPLQVRHTRNHRRHHWHPGAVNSASSRRRSSVSWQVHQADLGALTVSAETPPPRPRRHQNRARQVEIRSREREIRPRRPKNRLTPLICRRACGAALIA